MSAKYIVKPSAGKYKWQQTAETVQVTLPVFNTLMKNVEVVISDVCLKVNVPKINYVQVVDFPHEIDFEHAGNRVQLTDEGLDVYLHKVDPNNWNELQMSGISGAELTARRLASLDRYYDKQNANAKASLSTKHEHDRHVINAQMKTETFQRDSIDSKRKNQEMAFTRELDADLKSIEAKSKIKNKEPLIKPNTDEAKRYNKTKVESIFDYNEVQTYENKENSGTQGGCEVEEIVSEEEEEEEPVIEEVPAELPSVRAGGQQEIGFTEKKFAHLPMRESQNKEAPYPKSKNLDKSKNDVFVDIEDKDPVWLKDKGDHFFKRADFNAATHAYTKALKEDPKFAMARLNRASCFILMRLFDLCTDDCNELETQVNDMKPEDFEQDKEFYNKIMARMYVKRAASHCWASKFEESLKDFKTLNESETYQAILGQKCMQELQIDLSRVLCRQSSQEIKKDGDLCFYKQNLTEALGFYNQALEKDEDNEYALANIGVIHLKRLDYEDCIDYSSRALTLVESFQPDTKSFSKMNVLEIKLLLRRAKSYEMLDRWEESKKDLDRILILEPQNQEAGNLSKSVQSKLDSVLFTQFRAEGNEFLKNKKFQQAMETYEKCLKITRKATSLDNIAIYVNKLACLLSLDRLQQTVQEANEAIRLIKNYKNRFDVKGEDANRLKQMDLRVAVRKGNALAKLNKTTDAIAEYERALRIDPSAAGVDKDLAALRKQR